MAKDSDCDSDSDGSTTRIRGSACESGWNVCDSIRNVSTVGHLGEVIPS
jgi:hypothetical protein